MELDSIISGQITLAAIAVWLLEKAKSASWFTVIDHYTDKLNVAIAAFLGAISTVGIEATFDSEKGVFMVTGLTASAVAHFVWGWAQQMTFQQLAYHGVVKTQKKSKEEQAAK